MDMRNVKFTAGMTQEFEVIKTNAPSDLIEKQLMFNADLEYHGYAIDNPYGMLEENGYSVQLITSSDEECYFDCEETYDWYDYYED